MTSISEAEKQGRRLAVESTIGTHAMEGIRLHPKTLQIMEQYAGGALSLEQFSSAMQEHAEETLRAIQQRNLAGAA